MGLDLRCLDLAMKVYRQKLVRRLFGAGLAITFGCAAWKVTVGPYVIIPGAVFVVAGVALAPKRRR